MALVRKRRTTNVDYPKFAPKVESRYMCISFTILLSLSANVEVKPAQNVVYNFTKYSTSSIEVVYYVAVVWWRLKFDINEVFYLTFLFKESQAWRHQLKLVLSRRNSFKTLYFPNSIFFPSSEIWRRSWAGRSIPGLSLTQA